MTKKNQRFIDEFLPLFDNDLTLNDIPNLLKVRDSFEPKDMNKFFSKMKLEDKKSILDNVITFLITHYVPSLIILLPQIAGYPPEYGESVSIAKLKSNEDEIRYLCIDENVGSSKENYEEPDFFITIKGYIPNEFQDTMLIDCIRYGANNYIDYYFFNCLNLTDGTIWTDVNSDKDFVYTFDTINFSIKNDQKFEPIGMKDFDGQDLYDKSLVWAKFSDTDRYRTVIHFHKESGRCLIHTPVEGLHIDISQYAQWQKLTELKKII